jgi:hypothetical protein
MQVRKISGPQRACIMQPVKRHTRNASLPNTPLAGPLTTLRASNATVRWLRTAATESQRRRKNWAKTLNAFYFEIESDEAV